MWISPNHKNTDFQPPLSLDDKISIFEDRVIGWKLDIADQVINGKKLQNGTKEHPGIPHSGYATLDILFSYFEMIGKYEAGFTQNIESEKYFKAGVISVFPSINEVKSSTKVPGVTGKVVPVVDFLLENMYKGIRCGLYHIGATNTRVVLTGGTQNPFSIDLQNLILVVNPHLLVGVLKGHFVSYIARLRDPNNHDLRSNFEARFDFDNNA